MFVFITVIFWHTFWRNKWLSVFDAVKKLCYSHHVLWNIRHTVIKLKDLSLLLHSILRDQNFFQSCFNLFSPHERKEWNNALEVLDIFSNLRRTFSLTAMSRLWLRRLNTVTIIIKYLPKKKLILNRNHEIILAKYRPPSILPNKGECG